MKKLFAAFLPLVTAAALMSACASQSANTTAPAEASGAVSVAAATGDMFTDRDIDASYNEAESVLIGLADGGSTASGAGASIEGDTVTISAEGTYILTGELSDGQVVVNSTQGKVQLVLDGVSIKCSDSAAIYVEEAQKVFVTLAEGTVNSLETTGEYVNAEDAENIDAALYSEADIALNGTGSLTASSGAGNAVSTEKDLKITGGAYELSAGNHGLKAKNSVRIAGGSFDITSAADGVHSEDADDASKGYVYIAGGSLSIAAGDDGIHAFGAVTVCGGGIDITQSVEGIEGFSVDISAGEISIVSSDDGINSSDGSGTAGNMQMPTDMPAQMPTGEKPSMPADFPTGETPPNMPEGQMPTPPDMPEGAEAPRRGEFGGGGMRGMMGEAIDGCDINISGGEIFINAEGDGIDSNGSLTISGGSVTIEGTTGGADGALDYAGTGVITGGTLCASGTSSMAMGFSEDSTQCSILYALGENQAEGSPVSLKDAQGNTVAEFTPSKSFNCIQISAPQLTEDGTYTLCVGAADFEIAMQGKTYSNGGGMGRFR